MYYFEIRRLLRQRIRIFQQSPAGKNLTQLPKRKLAILFCGLLSVWHIIGVKIAESKDPDFAQKAAEKTKLAARQREMDQRNYEEKKRRRAVDEANKQKIWSRPMISVAKTKYPLDCD